jgi:hypothetical protein
MEMVQGCEGMLKGSRGGQGWTWSPLIFSMGTNFTSAHHVFDKMPARNLFSNFEILFGGLYSYNIWSIMVVVVVNLVLVCKISKWHRILVLFQCLHLACF